MSVSNYASIVGRIRVLETKFIKESDIERMVGAKSLKDAFLRMRELDTMRDIKDDCSEYNFNYIINKFLEREKDFIKKGNPVKGSLKFIWYEYDAHNMKVLLKARLKKLDKKEYSSALYYNMGNIDVSDMEDFVLNDKKLPIGSPEQFHSYKERVLRYYDDLKNIQIVDFMIDRMYLKLALDIASKTKSNLIINFIKHRIDLTNVRTFLRGQSLMEDVDLISRAFIMGGFIPYSIFETYFSKPTLEFINSVSGKEYSDLLSIGYKSYKEENSYVLLEKLIDEYLLSLLHETKYYLFGPEILFAYYWVQRNSAQMLKLVLLGKLNNLSNDAILKRLRKVTL